MVVEVIRYSELLISTMWFAAILRRRHRCFLSFHHSPTIILPYYPLSFDRFIRFGYVLWMGS